MNKKKIIILLIFIVILVGGIVFLFINRDSKNSHSIVLEDTDSPYYLTNVNSNLIGKVAVGIKDGYEIYVINSKGEYFSLGQYVNVGIGNEDPVFIGVIDSKLYYNIIYQDENNKNYYMNIYSVDLNNYDQENKKFGSTNIEYEKLDLNFSKNSFNSVLDFIDYNLIVESKKDLDDDGFCETKYVTSFNILTGKSSNIIEQKCNDSSYSNKYYYYLDENGKNIYSKSISNGEEKRIFTSEEYITSFYVSKNVLNYETGYRMGSGTGYSTGKGTYNLSDNDDAKTSNPYSIEQNKLLYNNKVVHKFDFNIKIMSYAGSTVILTAEDDSDLNIYQYDINTNSLITTKNVFKGNYDKSFYSYYIKYIEQYN